MKSMEKKKSNKFETRWEFVFKLNENIVCQRYFDVRSYNEQSPDSVEFRETFSEITDEIMGDLKERTLSSMNNDRHKYYSISNYNDSNTKDDFYFQVMVDGEVVMEQIMDGNLYPKTVKSSVDIRPMIPGIIYKLQKTMSNRNLTYYPEIQTGYDDFYANPNYNYFEDTYKDYL